ncbi:MAG TPA: alcohol dehydrogenase catalytic domain-containing protein [Solirubrobacterales bacterium]|nr:alcohol dehydrogenase catalytic domain-containing protein [Solirubrobacterales bacterium]
MDELEPDWVRLRFLHCGICGSDLSQFEGRPDATYPISVGHEFVAEAIEVGNRVRRLGPGDLVTSDLNYRCGACDHCSAGRSHLCRKGQEGYFTNRAFSDIGDIEESYLLALKGPGDPHLALCEPLSCVLHAKEWARLSPVDRILVIGAGGIGLCMAFALCRQRPALGFEITDLIDERLARIARPIEPLGRCVDSPAGEYDVVFDLSGTEEGLQRACEHVRAGGRICSMSHPNGEEISPFLVSAILRLDVTFTASYLNGEPVRLQEAARLLEREWSPVWDETLEIVPLQQLQQAYEQRPRSPWCKTIVDVTGSTVQRAR